MSAAAQFDELPGPGASPREVPGRVRRRRALATAGVLAVVAATAVGCSGSSSEAETLDPPTVVAASAEPTTTPSSAPTASPSAPTPAAPPAEGADGRVQDGHDLGFLRSITEGPDGPTVVLDRAVLLSGEEANAEAEARGLESPVPNDVLVVNDNPRLREYPVSPDADVTLTVGLTTAEPTDGGVESTLGELRTLLPPPSDEPISGYLFDVVVEDGVVVALDHVYLP